MRRLKPTSFRESGPPADWERRFAAIVRESRRVEPPASRCESTPVPPSPQHPVAGSRLAGVVVAIPGNDQPSAAAGFAVEDDDWARLWSAASLTRARPAPPAFAPPAPAPAAPAPTAPAPAGSAPTPISFDGFERFAAPAEPAAPEKRSALAGLKLRLVKATRRTPIRPPAAAAGPAATDHETRAVHDTAAGGWAPPDFPRRPVARAGAAAWLSRTDGPLRTTATVPVAGPAMAAALVIVASGLTAAYLTHRLGIDFDPVIQSVVMPGAPLPAPAVAAAFVALVPPIAPMAALPIAPVALGPSPSPAPAHRPLPPAAIRALEAQLARAVADPETAGSAGPRATTLAAVVGPPVAAALPLPAIAAPARPGPAVTAPLPGPRRLLPAVRPVLTMAAPPGSTTELVPSLPFPVEVLAAGNAGAEPIAVIGTIGQAYDPLPPPVAPLVPASAVAAEAITAGTVDAVPADGRPSDARLDDGSQRRLAVPASSPADAQGPSSPLVVDVQRALWRHGINPGPVDGIAGPRTEAAVRSFQRRVGEWPDGVVDAAVLQHLTRTPPTQLADGVPDRSGERDPLAGVVRVLGDLFGLPAGRARNFDGSIASAGGPQGGGDAAD